MLLTALVVQYLKAGNLERAQFWAKQLKTEGSSLATAVLGNPKKAFKRIEKAEAAPLVKEQSAYYATIALAWMGDLENAKAGCALARRVAPKKNSLYAPAACAAVALEKGNPEELYQVLESYSTQWRDASTGSSASGSFGGSSSSSSRLVATAA